MIRPPSVDVLARSLTATGLPHPLRVSVARAAIAAGDASLAGTLASELSAGLLRPVINATGVLLHTNLGRAPVGVSIESSYHNLEFDLVSGRRGGREGHAGSLLATACGAEAVAVVNNGAAAVLLVLSALAGTGGVAVSRGELIEIGGGFRIPDVMAASGARIVEVGTTNRTRRSDYARVAGQVDLLLKVHRSNFHIVGFEENASVAELATLGLPVVVDLGSGLLDESCPWLEDGPPPWLVGEPGVRQTLAGGASVVTFSGDKLLGGPQAGLIAGSAEAVASCLRHPLYRALRPGQLVLASLQAVALAYLARDASRLPLWRMATETVVDLRRRADSLGVGRVVDCDGLMGGGTLPAARIPSVAVAIDGDRRSALLGLTPPIVARVKDGTTLLDLRTIDPSDDRSVAESLALVATAPAP